MANEDTDYDPVISGRRRAAREARASVVAGQEYDPEQAAQAYALEQETGVPSSIIFGDGDVKPFVREQRTIASAELAATNRRIAQFVASHPMAAAAAGDDIGNLDNISSSFDRYNTRRTTSAEGAFTRTAVRGVAPMVGSLPAMGAGATAGAALGAPLGPAGALAGGIVGGMVGGIGGSYAVSLAQDWLLSKLDPSTLRALGQDPEQLRLDQQMHGTAAFLGGLAPFLLAMRPGRIPTVTPPPRATALERIMSKPLTARVFGAGAMSGFEAGHELYAGEGIDPFKIGMSAAFGAVFARNTKFGEASMGAGANFAQRVVPYLRGGKEPPVGLDPIADGIKIKEAEESSVAFDELLKSVQASKLGDRGMLGEYLKQFPDAKVEVSAEAIRKLYGDKVPETGDGLLGDLPDAVKQMDGSEVGGGDISIPLKDWLDPTKVNKENVNQLKDQTRHRRGGVNKEEAEALLVAEAPFRMTLERRATDVAPGSNEHSFNLLDEGKNVGPIEGRTISFGELGELDPVGKAEYLAKDPSLRDDEKVFIIDAMSHPEKTKTNAPLGVAGARGMYEAIGREFPDITAVIGDRAMGPPRKAIYRVNTKKPLTTPAMDVVNDMRRTSGGKPIEALIEEARMTVEESAVEAAEARGPGAATEATPRPLRQPGASISEPAAAPPVKREVQLELPQAGTTRTEDRKPFMTGSAIGRTNKQQEAYLKAIEEVADADRKWEMERTVKAEEKKQTQEWKNNRVAARAEVADAINNRPDIAADSILRGIDPETGKKLTAKVKLDSEKLSPEQRALLPDKYLAKDGMHPDDLATLVGVRSGDELVARLADLYKERGDSRMVPKKHIDRLIDIETDHYMEAKYGDLKENIIEAAKEHIFSGQDENLLHEQILLIAEKGKLEYSITKDALNAGIREELGQMPIELIDSDRFLADAGRAGKKMEAAFLKDDFVEAFRQAQAQFYSRARAKIAYEHEVMYERFANRAAKYAKRDVPGVLPEYTNFIQLGMLKLGQKIGKSVQFLQDEISSGAYKDFASFIAEKESKVNQRDLNVPDFMLDSTFNKPLNELTLEEFRQVNRALTSMDHNGRDELKYELAGDKQDLKEVLSNMIERIKSLGPAKKYPIDRPSSKILDTTKSYWWSGINLESMLNRLDRDNPQGMFFTGIVDKYVRASNSKSAMLKEYQQKLGELGDIKDLDKKVANDLFIDPITGLSFEMRQRNVLGILQNSGNVSNLKKMAEGYNLEPQQIIDWLRQRTTKDDWDRAQKIGNLFNELFGKANNMSRQISGVGIEGLELRPFTIDGIGSYEGWYNPIKYDSLRPGASKKQLGPNDLEGEGYYRATTNQGYTKERTGYVAPVELNLDIVPARMRQMIHDINMRPTVIELAKIFYDPSFKRAMIGHYGKFQAEEPIAFLRDIANSTNYKTITSQMGDQALEYFRQNTIATLIGFNPSTVMKHGVTAAINSMTEVGMVNWTREFLSLTAKDDISGTRNWTMAMEKSEQLQRRIRTNFTDLIKGHEQELTMAKSSYREFMISAGATPVAISDLLSAVPTWLAKYKMELAKGTDEGMAVSLADRAVRNAHGDSSLTNKPAIARTNALGAWFSSLYGFFSHMQQKQYALAWKASDLYKDVAGKGSGDIENATRHMPDLLKGLMSYVIFPAMIEEIVTPYTNKEKESWGKKAMWTLMHGVGASFVGVRDVMNAVVNTRDPQAGLLGTATKTVTDLGKDLSHGRQIFNRDRAGNLIKHTFALTGVLTGLTNAQEGKALEYLYRYYQGMEHPKGAWDVAVGLRYGKTKDHSRTFEQWLNHL